MFGRLVGFMRDYNMQLFAMVPGSLLMMNSGTQLGWGVMNQEFEVQEWTVEASTTLLVQIIICWHIFVAIGAICGSFIQYNINVFTINTINASIFAIASIILIVQPNEPWAVATCRCFGGFAAGLNYITFIIYGSELASPMLRSHIIFMLHFSLIIGLFIFSWINIPSVNLILGSINLFCSVLAGVIGFFTLKPAPIYLLSRDCEAEALLSYKHFHKTFEDASQSENELEKMKGYVLAEDSRRISFISIHNMRTLLLVILAKLTFVALFNATQNSIKIILLRPFLSGMTRDWTPIFLSSVHLLGGLLAFFTFNIITHRFRFLTSGIISSILLVAFGVIIFTFETIINWLPLLFFIPLEFILGIGIGPVPNILKSEIFPQREKKFSVAFAILVEETLQVVFVLVTFQFYFNVTLGYFVNLFVFGIYSLFSCWLVFFFIRDSRFKSIVDTSNLYKK